MDWCWDVVVLWFLFSRRVQNARLLFHAEGGIRVSVASRGLEEVYKRQANSISLGMSSPGFHSPACKLCKIRPLICWYKGLKAGVCTTALSLRAGVGVSEERAVLGGMFKTGAVQTVWSQAEEAWCSMPSIISYIRHKTICTHTCAEIVNMFWQAGSGAGDLPCLRNGVSQRA